MLELHMAHVIAGGFISPAKPAHGEYGGSLANGCAFQMEVFDAAPDMAERSRWGAHLRHADSAV